MPAMTNLSGMWKAFSEINIGSMREDAQMTPRVAVIGARERANLLTTALHEGPRAANQLLTAPSIYAWPLSDDALNALAGYDLRIAILRDAAQAGDADVQALIAQESPLALVIEHDSAASVVATGPQPAGPNTAAVVAVSLDDGKALHKTLLPALAKALPDAEIALARAYPGLRPAVVQGLIQRTCMTNSLYAAGTGVAEMIPGLGIPFAVADIIILTKNQLVMAYKIGLAMGETGEFREVLPQLAGVVGAGFMWRQVARELVAFLPLGVVLKVAIAYAGTFATGQAIYHWYSTGERLTRTQLREVFAEALERGKAVAAELTARLRKGDQPALPEPEPAKRRRIALPGRRAKAAAAPAPGQPI